jgi:hypothetical protein
MCDLVAVSKIVAHSGREIRVVGPLFDVLVWCGHLDELVDITN